MQRAEVEERGTVRQGRTKRDLGPVLRRSIGPLLSLVSLAGVVWWASNQERPEFPSSAQNVAPLFAALGVYATVTAIRGWRWHRVLLQARISHPAADAYGLVVVGYMGNNVLPARGGELLRVLLMAERAGARKRDVIGSIVAERLLDVIALVGLFTLMTLAGVAGSPAGWRPVAGLLGLAAIAGAALSVVIVLRRRGRFERAAELLRPFVRASHLLVGPVGAVLIAVTAGFWLLEGTIYWLVGQSLDLDISLVEGAFLAVLLSFVGALPSAPGYLGTYDAALVFGLEALGVTGGDAVAFVVLVRAIIFVPITITGLTLVLVRYGGLPWRRRRSAS